MDIKKTLQKIINNFEQETRSISNNYNDNIDKKQTTTFPWIPKIGPKIKEKMPKFVRFVIKLIITILLKAQAAP